MFARRAGAAWLGGQALQPMESEARPARRAGQGHEGPGDGDRSDEGKRLITHTTIFVHGGRLSTTGFRPLSRYISLSLPTETGHRDYGTARKRAMCCVEEGEIGGVAAGAGRVSPERRDRRRASRAE